MNRIEAYARMLQQSSLEANKYKNKNIVAKSDDYILTNIENCYDMNYHLYTGVYEDGYFYEKNHYLIDTYDLSIELEYNDLNDLSVDDLKSLAWKEIIKEL